MFLVLLGGGSCSLRLFGCFHEEREQGAETQDVDEFDAVVSTLAADQSVV